MRPLTLILLQNDANVARALSGELCRHFHAIHIVRSLPELREAMPRLRADVVIVDVEAAALSEIERLHRDFGNVSVVCTHRLADEDLWTAALSAGAADVCCATDTGGIIRAATANVAIARSAAA